MGGFIGPIGGGGGGGSSPVYALDYARLNGSLSVGTEISVHHIDVGSLTPGNATVGWGTVTFHASPLAAARRVVRLTSNTTTGPLLISNAAPTAPSADRSFEMVFKISANRSTNYVALANIGPFGSAECFGCLRGQVAAAPNPGMDFQAGAGNGAGTGNVVVLYEDTTDIVGLWVYFLAIYDASEGEYTLYWRAEGDADWSSATLAFANAGTGSVSSVRLGGDSGSFYGWPGDYAFAALHDAALDTTYRDGMWSLLGL